jgi:hypothetical protein
VTKLAQVTIGISLFALASVGSAQSPLSLSLAGEQQGTKYKLSLEYHTPEKGKFSSGSTDSAGILVWAEPSHTLLMAYWNTAQTAENPSARLV